MPKTAWDITGDPTTVLVTFKFMDASGDKRSDSFRIPYADYVNGEVSTLGIAMGAATNATMYGVKVTQEWQTVPDKEDAVNAPKDSVQDNIVILLKNAVGDSKRIFIPAPDDAMLDDGASDQVGTGSNPLLLAVANAALAVFTGYSVVSARYTERREINEAVPL